MKREQNLRNREVAQEKKEALRRDSMKVKGTQDGNVPTRIDKMKVKLSISDVQNQTGNILREMNQRYVLPVLTIRW